jgi:hypothetical protein
VTNLERGGSVGASIGAHHRCMPPKQNAGMGGGEMQSRGGSVGMYGRERKSSRESR